MQIPDGESPSRARVTTVIAKQSRTSHKNKHQRATVSKSQGGLLRDTGVDQEKGDG